MQLGHFGEFQKTEHGDLLRQSFQQLAVVIEYVGFRPSEVRRRLQGGIFLAQFEQMTGYFLSIRRRHAAQLLFDFRDRHAATLA
jgi:hypothetical protein